MFRTSRKIRRFDHVSIRCCVLDENFDRRIVVKRGGCKYTKYSPNNLCSVQNVGEDRDDENNNNNNNNNNKSIITIIILLLLYYTLGWRHACALGVPIFIIKNVCCFVCVSVLFSSQAAMWSCWPSTGGGGGGGCGGGGDVRVCQSRLLWVTNQIILFIYLRRSFFISLTPI